MSKRENCEHRHTNGNCLFNGGFCLANDEEHCVRINEIKSYNQALEDFERKMAFFCFGLRASEGNLCRVDVVEDELQRVKRQLTK